MADEVDLAQDQIEASLASARYAAAKQPRLRGNGFCHNCEAPLPTGWLFCDSLCRADLEARQAAQARAGTIGTS